MCDWCEPWWGTTQEVLMKHCMMCWFQQGTNSMEVHGADNVLHAACQVLSMVMHLQHVNKNVALGVANAVREEQQHGDFLDTPVCDVAGVQVQI